MRVTLLSRDAAARVITSAVSMLAWSAGAAVIVLSMPLLIETLVMQGHAAALPLPLAVLLIVLAAIFVTLWRTTPLKVVGYLLVVGVLAVVFELYLLGVDPGILQDELYLLNRPALALATIGVASSSAFIGILWSLVGFVASNAIVIIVAVIADIPVRFGWGPCMVLVLSVVLHLTLFLIQVRQRRRFPRFDELEQATRQRAASADLARRATAVVHDTVLNDLTMVMNAPDVLDERTRVRLLDDLETFEDGAWLRATTQVAVHDVEQAQIRNDLARIVSDFRWRGLTVTWTGESRGVYAFKPRVGEALVSVLRAVLENVLLHSGTDSADIEAVYTDDEVVFMISDQGVGFDPDAVDPRRLGIRMAIIARMEEVGGRAQVWSSPGAGTSVLVAAPVAEVFDRGEPPRHQELDYED